MRALGNFNRIRDLTTPGMWDSPKLDANAVLGKKTIFRIAMTEVRDAGLS